MAGVPTPFKVHVAKLHLKLTSSVLVDRRIFATAQDERADDQSILAVSGAQESHD
jgi:hypothetical protein